MQALTVRQLLALVVLTLMWGVNWPMMKLSLREMDPLYFRAVTMSLGAGLLALYFGARGVRLRPQGWAEWRVILLLGLPNILGWHGLSVMGLVSLPAGRAATLGFTMPVWTVLLGVLFYGERLTARLALAVLAVLCGITLLLWNEWAQLSGSPVGIVWMQAAALSWALGTIWMRRAQLTLPPQALVVWMMACASVVLLGLAVWQEPVPHWQFSLPMWGTLVWAVTINYGVSQVLWFSLARALPPAVSAMSVMAVPLLGTLSAPLIVGEWPQWQDLAAMGCVVVAIGAVLLRRG